MNSRFVRFGFSLLLLAGLFGTAFAHEQGNGDSLRAEPNYFPRQESCPQNFFWQTVTNKTPFNIRIFIDGKPFSTEIYALSPKVITDEIDAQTGKPKELYYGATRCFPEGKHEVRIIAFVYEKMPLSTYGRVEVLKGENIFFYDSTAEGKNISNPMWIEETGLSPIAFLGRKNMEHNSALVFLILGTVFAAGIMLFLLARLLRLSKKY